MIKWINAIKNFDKLQNKLLTTEKFVTAYQQELEQADSIIDNKDRTISGLQIKNKDLETAYKAEAQAKLDLIEGIQIFCEPQQRNMIDIHTGLKECYRNERPISSYFKTPVKSEWKWEVIGNPDKKRSKNYELIEKLERCLGNEI